MFKFDFQVETEEGNDFLFSCEKTKDPTDCLSNRLEPEITCRKSERVLVNSSVLDNLDIARLNSNQISYGGLIIDYMITGLVLEDIKANEKDLDISAAEDQTADLIPGIYEGGAKVWECTDDLLNYLNHKLGEKYFAEKNVLDLGCGAGLLGIYAYKLGSTVQFQDYNIDVLNKITIPNVLLNSNEALEQNSDDSDLQNLNKQVQFYSGDWSDFVEITKGEDKFDVILTSETIYNPENHQKLIDVFGQRLKADGVVLLSAKTHYFGVGGGTRQFEDLLKKDQRFESSFLWSSKDGVNREILEIKFK